MTRCGKRFPLISALTAIFATFFLFLTAFSIGTAAVAGTPQAQMLSEPTPSPGYEHSKTSDPAPGSQVSPGAQIIYTVEGRNTGNTVLDPVVIQTDMSQVLSSVWPNSDATVRILDAQGSVVNKSTLSLDLSSESTLSWSGALQPGQRVQIVYGVVVSPNVFPYTMLRNRLASEATPPSGSTLKPEPVVVDLWASPGEPVADGPRYEHSMTSNPAPGVVVPEGSKVTYTASGRNLGSTNSVSFDVDMSQVLNKASYNNDAVMRILDDQGNVVVREVQPPSPPWLEEATLSTWSFELLQGQRLQMVYSVTVNEGVAEGSMLRSKLTSRVAAKPINELAPVVVEHSTASDSVEPPASKYEQSKSSDLNLGATVQPGSKITYTVEGRNTGNTVLDRARVEDDLAPALANASYNNDATVRVLDAQNEVVLSRIQEAAVLDGTMLLWSGVLQPGQRVQLVYSVTVNQDVSPVVVPEVVAPETTKPGTTVITGAVTGPGAQPLQLSMDPLLPNKATGPVAIGGSSTSGSGALAVTGAGGWMSAAMAFAAMAGISGLALLRLGRRRLNQAPGGE